MTISITDKASINARAAICKICEEYNSTIKTCKNCNCFIPAKVIFVSSKCPKKKW